MALLDDVLAWSDTLQSWQRDALRRLFGPDPLLEADVQELLQLLKREHSLDVETQLVPIPLSTDHIQAGVTNAEVRLLALNKLTNVNGFPDGRSLTFEPQGMTVIFGENGAGKSGYARVLKNACRARKREAVRPNAFDEKRGHIAPEADIEMTVNGSQRTYHWAQGGPIDNDLASVSVYDTMCAGDYIEAEGTLAFQPFGLSQLADLAKLCGELERRINAEIRSLPCDASPFQGLQGETDVGQFIRSLGATSDLAEARRLGTFSSADADRATELASVLAETNPEPRAMALERLATRLEGIAKAAERAHTFTSDHAVERMRQLAQNNLNAKAANRAAQHLLQNDDLLPGTGSDIWRALYDAAKQYSVQIAYPGLDHPHIEDGARCVLCQTVIGSEAKSRLKAFSTFVESSTATAAVAAANNLSEARRKFSEVDFSLGVDETLMAEVADSVPQLKTELSEWIRAWSERRAWTLTAMESNDWDMPTKLPTGPNICESITSTTSSMRASAKTLRLSADPDQRNRLLKEQRELQARQAFTPLIQAVERFVENSRKVRALRECVASLNPGPISRQLTSFADTYITQALLDSMRSELNILGYRRSVRHRVPRRTDRGVTLVRVSLEGTSHPPEDVLSEGEQRATAFAFFLADVGLSSIRAPLVFDDPVTSMDHRYRRSVAKRLAQIAKGRQVIVFTHDAVFLMALHHACEEQECQVTYRTVEWDSAPGLAIDGLGWDQMKTGQRVGDLKQRLAEIRNSWEEYPSEASKAKMTNAYSGLRGTIERLIREDLLNGVIQPYSDEVHVEKFTAVIGIDPAEWMSLLDVYDRACEATRAHDTTSEQQLDVPDPQRLRDDIAVIEVAIRNATVRRKTASTLQAERAANRRSIPRSSEP